MRQEFRIVLSKAMTVVPADFEPKLSTSMSTDPHDTSSPRVLWTHHQHAADYVKLLIEEGEDLTLGKDRAAPLITEVCSPVLHTSIFKFTVNSSCFPAQFITPFSFRHYRRSPWPTILKEWLICCMQTLCSNQKLHF